MGSAKKEKRGKLTGKSTGEKTIAGLLTWRVELKQKLITTFSRAIFVTDSFLPPLFPVLFFLPSPTSSSTSMLALRFGSSA